MFAQRIAVISSATAAGYGDFCKHLSENEYGYVFRTQLFPAILQGEGVEKSVVDALNLINEHSDEFDCVVITRGGGATCDLSGFDTFNLAFNVANFPLPIITAIGHDRDESVLDMVAHTRVKTPTAAAAFLIDSLHQIDLTIERASQRIISIVKNRMVNEKARLRHLSSQIPTLFAVVSTAQLSRLKALQKHMENLTNNLLFRQKLSLDKINDYMCQYAMQKITEEKHRIELLSQRVEALDPKRILERGYSITWHKGRVVTDKSDLSKGETIETQVMNGRFESIVT
jgi:exodeoxyribonuclease VII large subunit